MSADVTTLLQQANAHLARGDFVRGEALLQQARAQQPDDPAILFSLGNVLRAQGRGAEAAGYYKQAIQIDPGKPDAYLHLAQLLRSLGRAGEAIPLLEEALRFAPDDARIFLELGLAHAANSAFTAAEETYRKALKLKPDFAAAALALTACLIAQERADEVETVAADALKHPTLSPRERAALMLNLSIARVQQQRAAESLKLLDEARRLAPNLPQADYNRANTLQMLGRMEEAERAYLMALRANPLDLRAHTGLNQLLYRMASPNFLRSYDEAARSNPRAHALFAEKAKFLFLAGRFDDAKTSYIRALEGEPENAAWREGLAQVLTRLGAFGEASAQFDRVLQSGRATADTCSAYAENLLRAGDPEKGLALSEQALSRAPDDQLAIALWGTALRRLSDARESELNDYENFLRIYDLDPPEGFSDMAAFNAALNASLDPLHTDRREHINQTLRLGTKTLGNLFGTGNRLVDLLQAQIDKAIADFLAEMKESAQHPLLRRRTRAFAYAGSWSVRLSDCGFHTNHVHPKGWISSAYYVDVPGVAADPAARQGWIKFGETNFDAGLADPVRRAVQPVPGRLVLFPSYMWHGTIPFRSASTRTTIAFDVLPRAT
ncbi:MAG TPA: tetratricopeptide repeat protein [Rhizomicrobium sp.]|nr:tetratricopeptide repeat protein [Rhizomicrobium sp.]